MAKTMQFDLVSPERSLASLKATAVQLPGSEGQMTVGPGHTPLITTLKPGMLTITGEAGTLSFAVTGGFAEISEGSTTVLAERAYERGPEARAALETALADARAAADAAKGPEKDTAEMLVADFVHLLADMQ